MFVIIIFTIRLKIIMGEKMLNMEMGKKVYPETEFVQGKWNKEINVRDFIQRNYTPYEGNSDFLEGPTNATKNCGRNV